jgi:hypothetical protein
MFCVFWHPALKSCGGDKSSDGGSRIRISFKTNGITVGEGILDEGSCRDGEMRLPMDVSFPRLPSGCSFPGIFEVN